MIQSYHARGVSGYRIVLQYILGHPIDMCCNIARAPIQYDALPTGKESRIYWWCYLLDKIENCVITLEVIVLSPACYVWRIKLMICHLGFWVGFQQPAQASSVVPMSMRYCSNVQQAEGLTCSTGSRFDLQHFKVHGPAT